MMDHVEAHRFSSNHRERLLKDEKCGCFYCLEIFDPKEITEWIEDSSGTAICPYCGVDAVIGQHSGYPITKEFLKKDAAVLVLSAYLRVKFAGRVMRRMRNVLSAFDCCDGAVQHTVRIQQGLSARGR